MLGLGGKSLSKIFQSRGRRHLAERPRSFQKTENGGGTLNKKNRFLKLRLHPLFIAVGIWYSLTGELFLFLLSCLVAVQHECAHAFAAARLGYKLNQIVLMPFGAVIDGDLKNISVKDEIFVAVCGPLCNLLTAAFFAAIWWFAPTMYAFTDTAYHSSLAIALVNFLPAYPLDGGRILKGVLENAFSKSNPQNTQTTARAEKICRLITFLFSAVFIAAFLALLFKKTLNISLLAFGGFLFFGAVGNQNKQATYDKMDFSCKDALRRGVELKRVAVLASCPIKNVLRYVTRGTYLVLEVYDEAETHLFDLPQNELSRLFWLAKTPYETLRELKTQNSPQEKSQEKPSGFYKKMAKNA